MATSPSSKPAFPDDSSPVELKESILCADDDLFIRELYRRILSSRGYQVRTCEDGSAVIPELLAAPADMLILDVEMPNMDGLSVLQAIRKDPHYHDLPILMVTSIESEEGVEEGLAKGADDYLIKPVKPGELLAKVTLAFNKRKFAKLTRMGYAFGALFNRRYEIQDSLGAGGYSTIYHAIDTQSDPPMHVALKIWDLPAAHREDDNFLSHFLREAYEHSKMDHPNIVKLYDFGQSDSIYFLAIEYLKGETLMARLQRGPMKEAELVSLGYELAKALMHMNEHSVVHRDLKPQNVMLTSTGEVKLLDFGLARRKTDDTLSVSDEFQGSPMFVSPEHVRGDLQIDTRADIYSLGATLYYAASKVFPIQGDSVLNVLMNHLKQEPEPLSKSRPELSLQLSMLIMRMLAKAPDDRPSVTELLQRFMLMNKQMKNS